MTQEKQWSRSDFEIRNYRDHYASFNKITGKKLYEGRTHKECSDDLDEEYGPEI